MRASLLALLAVVTGCHKLFGLVTVELGDASAIPDTQLADGASCVGTTVHDEDGDGVVDNCDSCPTVAGVANDSDGDGLADECDPNLSSSADGDAIYRASVFKSMTDLSSDYDTGGTAPASVANGRVVLPAGAQIQLKLPIIPTQIVAAVSSFGLATLEIAANGVSCQIASSGCANEADQICVAFNAAGVTKPAPASSIKTITVRRSAAALACDIVTADTTYSFTATGKFINSIPFIRVTGAGGATVELDSLVFYVEK